LLFLVVAAGCTGDAIATPRAGRVRLHSSWTEDEGVRFRDGTVVTKDADLELQLNRETLLLADGDNLCELPERLASIEVVRSDACSAWRHLVFLQARSASVDSAEGMGLVLRRPVGEVRLWVVESGPDSVILDYIAD